MNMNSTNTRKYDIPDTIASLTLMQESLMSELHVKQSSLSLTGSEAQYLREQNKMLQQQIAIMINIVRNFERPMN